MSLDGESVLQHDLTNLLKDRLLHACNDYVGLCNVAEISRSDCYASMQATLTIIVCRLYASLSTIRPEEAGEKMAQLIRAMREDLHDAS